MATVKKTNRRMDGGRAMISVIVPIYGRPQYLETCINSILSQTYKEFEVICIMDGPCRETEELLEKIEQTDSRVRHYEIEHQGVACARNEGMKHAVGQYLFFSDADDTLPKDSFYILEECARKTMADVVIGDYCEIFDDGKKVYFKTPTNEPDDFNPFLESVTIWNRLYRSEWIKRHNICFDKRFRGDDRIFTTELFLTSPTIAVINKVVYNWLRHDSDIVASITHNRSVNAFVNDMEMWNYFMDIMPLKWEERLNDHMRYSCQYIADGFINVIDCEEKQIAFEQLRKLVQRIKWDGNENLFKKIFGMEREKWLSLKEYTDWNRIYTS